MNKWWCHDCGAVHVTDMHVCPRALIDEPHRDPKPESTPVGTQVPVFSPGQWVWSRLTRKPYIVLADPSPLGADQVRVIHLGGTYSDTEVTDSVYAVTLKADPPPSPRWVGWLLLLVAYLGVAVAVGLGASLRTDCPRCELPRQTEVAPPAGDW